MRRFHFNLDRLCGIALLLSLSACVPKKNTNTTSGKTIESDEFSLTTVRVGPGAAYNAEIYQGNYYSKYNPVVVNGLCKGEVKKVLVSDTPLSGATTSQTVTCSNGTFSWTKSLTTQTSYTLLFTPQNSSGTTISSISPVSKTYTYDITNPSAPYFVSPTFTTHYTITNGATNITIVGQVLNEVVKMVGPNSLNLPLMADVDGIHKNFYYSATVPASTSVNFTFTGSDAASNSTSNTLTIDSVLSLSIPVAAQEVGGSHVDTGSLKIESSVGFMSEVVIDSNVKHVTGSAGIMGNL